MLYINNILLFIYTLLSSNHEIDIQDMNYKNKHILGVTTLWTTYPIFHVFYTFNNNILIFIATLLTFICIVSTLFWSNPKGNSFLHKADKFLVQIFFIIILLYSIQIEFPIFKLIIILSLIIVFYIMSYIFFVKQYTILQCISHIIFRYIFFWWCYIIMVPIQLNFIIISIGYFSHIIVLYNINLHKLNYWCSCVILLCWIYYCSNIHYN
jgi:hypothetical protein